MGLGWEKDGEMAKLDKKAILKKHAIKLLAKKNVVAVGIGEKKIRGKGTGTIGIVVSVEKKDPREFLKKRDLVPEKIEGVITDVVETGKIKALKARTDRWRPAPGGVSCGHETITAGTLGCVVRKDGFKHILSNNHVLAASNAGAIGSAILQPGKYDGGQMIDRIALLTQFVEILFIGGDGCKIGQAVAGAGNFFAKIFGRKTRLETINTEQLENLVDAAIAKPITQDMIEIEILEIGDPTGVNVHPAIGMAVQKSGRTTGLTKGLIAQTDVITQVQYDEGKIALFVDQLMIEQSGFSAGGDSGSAVLDMEKKVVGLLFAGSDTTTIVNKIEHVLNLLNITIATQ